MAAKVGSSATNLDYSTVKVGNTTNLKVRKSMNIFNMSAKAPNLKMVVVQAPGWPPGDTSPSSALAPNKSHPNMTSHSCILMPWV